MSIINYSVLKQDLNIVPPPPRYSRSVETILKEVEKQVKEKVRLSANEQSTTSRVRQSRFSTFQIHLPDRPCLLKFERVCRMAPAGLTSSDPLQVESKAPNHPESQKEEKDTEAEKKLENENEKARIENSKTNERRIIKVIFQMFACSENVYKRAEINLDKDENKEIENARREAKTILVSGWLRYFESWFRKKNNIRTRPKAFNYNGIRRMTTERERYKFEGKLETTLYDHFFSVDEWEKIKVLTEGMKRMKNVKSILVNAEVNEIKPDSEKVKDKKKKEQSKKDKMDNG